MPAVPRETRPGFQHSSQRLDAVRSRWSSWGPQQLSVVTPQERVLYAATQPHFNVLGPQSVASICIFKTKENTCIYRHVVHRMSLVESERNPWLGSLWDGGERESLLLCTLLYFEIRTPRTAYPFKNN